MIVELDRAIISQLLSSGKASKRICKVTTADEDCRNRLLSISFSSTRSWIITSIRDPPSGQVPDPDPQLILVCKEAIVGIRANDTANSRKTAANPAARGFVIMMRVKGSDVVKNVFDQSYFRNDGGGANKKFVFL